MTAAEAAAVLGLQIEQTHFRLQADRNRTPDFRNHAVAFDENRAATRLDAKPATIDKYHHRARRQFENPVDQRPNDLRCKRSSMPAKEDCIALLGRGARLQVFPDIVRQE